MIFPVLRADTLVQVEDLFRIDLTGTKFSDGSEVDKIEIRPDADSAFFTIFDPSTNKGSYWSDWQYQSAGTKTITVKFTKDAEEKELSLDVVVKTKADEKLFSNDEKLLQVEPNILNLLPAWRNSFIYVHRLVQKEILKELKDEDFEDITLDELLDIEEVSEWATAYALVKIFESNITAPNDIHALKKATYEAIMLTSKARAVISLDTDGDGVEDTKILKFPTTLVRV